MGCSMHWGDIISADQELVSVLGYIISALGDIEICVEDTICVFILGLFSESNITYHIPQ